MVLYFYPKDDTSGCTLEAQGFSARRADFEAAGAVVVGISKDSVKSHDKFRDKHGLGLVLLSDEGSDVAERFGAWVEKSMYGRKYMGIDRSTFLIDADGTVARVWRKVKVPGPCRRGAGGDPRALNCDPRHARGQISADARRRSARIRAARRLPPPRQPS